MALKAAVVAGACLPSVELDNASMTLELPSHDQISGLKLALALLHLGNDQVCFLVQLLKFS